MFSSRDLRKFLPCGLLLLCVLVVGWSGFAFSHNVRGNASMMETASDSEDQKKNQEMASVILCLLSIGVCLLAIGLERPSYIETKLIEQEEVLATRLKALSKHRHCSIEGASLDSELASNHTGKSGMSAGMFECKRQLGSRAIPIASTVFDLEPTSHRTRSSGRRAGGRKCKKQAGQGHTTTTKTRFSHGNVSGYEADNEADAS